jgi:hypothetical protein
MLLSCGLLLQNGAGLHKMAGWWSVLKKKQYLWSHKYNSLCASSFIYHEEYFGWILKFTYLAIFKKCFYWWIITATSVVCREINEPYFLTARSEGLKTPSMAHVCSSLEQKVRVQGLNPAFNQKWWTDEGKIKNCDSGTWEGTYSGACCHETTKWDSQCQQ